MKKITASPIPLLLAYLVLALLVFSGCSSDQVAPQDTLPPPSSAELAFQAGIAARMVTNAYPVFQDAISPPKSGEKTPYDHSFASGGVSGVFTLDFRCGGATGTPCDSDSPGTDFLRVFTEGNESVDVKNAQNELLVSATFDVDVLPYDNTVGSEAGTVNGGGSLVAGSYTSYFGFEDVFLSSTAYPESGTMTYGPGSSDVRVTFDGTVNADLVVGQDQYTVNLDTGAVTMVK